MESEFCLPPSQYACFEQVMLKMAKEHEIQGISTHIPVFWTTGWHKCESCENEFASFRFVRVLFRSTGSLFLVCDKCQNLMDELSPVDKQE